MVIEVASVFNGGVQTTKKTYDKNKKKWKRCRDVIGGTDDVKDAAEIYLPRLKAQSVEDYQAYKKRANFFNATGRTHSGLVGMIFRKPPTTDFPLGEVIDQVVANIDLSGNPLDVFSRTIVEEILEVGNIGVLVDYPVAPPIYPLTVAQAQELNLRPCFKYYCRESIINWRYTVVNNAKTLEMVVVKETIEIQGQPEFTIKYQDQYRVLDLDESGLYRIRLYQIQEYSTDAVMMPGYPFYPTMNGQALNYIPFKFIVEDDDNEPPLLDLVDVNLSHYRSSADYETGCHFTGLPILYVFGYNVQNPDGSPAPIIVGSDTALVLSNPEAKAGYIEFSGQGLQSLVDNLDRKQQQMALLGARIIADQPKGIEAADTANIHRVGENSVLADIAIEVSLSMTQCLKWFFDWMSIDSSQVSYQLNRDFSPVTVDGPTLTAYIAALQNGALSEEELFDLLQRGDLIEADVSYENHKGQVAAYAQQKLAQQEQSLALTQKYTTQPQPGGK